jgi:hypothetical protein
MADTSYRSKSTRQLNNRVQGGYNASGPMGGVMGFMGLPFFTRGSATDSTPHGIGAGPGRMNYPWDNYGMNGGFGGGGGGPQIEDPPLPPYDPNDPNGDGTGGGTAGQQYWKFPQYSQTWAFTPPAPTPYPTPQPFDPKKYGNPFATSKK